MSTRREYYVSLAERLKVPQEIEPLPIKDLLLHSPTGNIYEVVSDISRRAENILAELTGELREKLKELDVQEDIAQRDETSMRELQAEIRQWVELYRSLPKPTLIAIWEKLNEKVPNSSS
ncbi:MAG: hypothetical protein RMJ66_00965 [Bacteroidia bacterium]|nr:hypothetical protein [Bacteroidia bacterium]MDW8133614.1 hypothetical protein [Bacteroidia bacterium]